MSDLRKLARVILIGLGVYIGIWAVFLVLAIPQLFLADSVNAVSVLSTVLGIAIMGLIVYLLLCKSDLFVERIVGPEEPVRKDVDWLPFAFRLTAVFAGMLYLYWVIPRMISSIRWYIVSTRPGMMSTRSPWSEIVGWIAQLALGVYLVFGAPHFVRWQVRKTLEQCKKLEGQGDAAEQDAAS